MHAVLLTGHGGLDQLQYRTDIATPHPEAGEVLIRVGAAGVNNTDINTRIGWYSKQVQDDTSAGATTGFGGEVDDDGGWSGALTFPRIQGADAVGIVVAVGEGVATTRLGERVMVRPMQAPLDPAVSALATFGSEMDGGFAQFARCRDNEALPINSALSDIDLASFPCAFSTAEGMLHRAEVGPDEHVLITGASGGVGSAAIQLARRRGARVTAVAGRAKHQAVRELGAQRVLDRDDDVRLALGNDRADVVVDLVAGAGFPALLEALRPSGRYVVSGAIAGPIVELDVRTLYLQDLHMIGSTKQDPEVFANLVAYIERGEVVPAVADTYPLAEIAAAQTRFLTKDFVGKLVLSIPPVGAGHPYAPS